MTDEQKIQKAIEMAVQHGGYTEAHHLAWCIDQMVRILADDKYEEVVKEAKAGADGPDSHAWDNGIAP